MLAFQRFSYIWTALIFYGINFFSERLFDFPMPSFLPLKLSLFTVGILVASAYVSSFDRKTKALLLSLSAGISLLSGGHIHHKFFLLTVTLLLQSLLFIKGNSIFSRIANIYRRILGNRIAAVMADLSYSVYLLHPMLMAPIAALLIRLPGYIDLPGVTRGILLTLLTAVPTYCISAVLFNFIEKPGTAAGKKIVKKFVVSRAF